MATILRRFGSKWLPLSFFNISINDAINIRDKKVMIQTTTQLYISDILKIWDDSGNYWGPAIITSLDYNEGTYTYNCEFYYKILLESLVINCDAENGYTSMIHNDLGYEVNRMISNISELTTFNGFIRSFIDESLSKNLAIRDWNEDGTTFQVSFFPKDIKDPQDPTKTIKDPAILITKPIGYSFVSGFDSNNYLSLAKNPTSNVYAMKNLDAYFSCDDGVTWIYGGNGYDDPSKLFIVRNPSDIPYRVRIKLFWNGIDNQSQANQYFGEINFKQSYNNWQNIFSNIDVETANADSSIIYLSGVKNILSLLEELARTSISDKPPYYFFLTIKPDGKLCIGIDNIFSNKSNEITLKENEDFVTSYYRSFTEDNITTFPKSQSDGSIISVYINDKWFKLPIGIRDSPIEYETTENQMANEIGEETSDITGLECTLISKKAKNLNVGDIVSIRLSGIYETQIMELTKKTDENGTIKGTFGHSLSPLTTAFSLLRYGTVSRRREI